MPETWYVLEDGTPADPNEVAPDDAGVLRHASGAPVALGPHGPRSRGMSAEEVEAARGKAKPGKKAAPIASDRQMKPKDGGKYETR